MQAYLTKNAFGIAIIALLFALGVAVQASRSREATSSASSPAPRLAAASGVSSQAPKSAPTPEAGVYTVNSLSPIPSVTGIPRPTPNFTPIPGAITGAPVLVPPVTEDSIRAFLSDPAKQSAFVHGDNVTVTGVQFMTASQAYALVKDPYLNNFPPDEPVAYVTMTGDFHAEGAPDMHTGYVIFGVNTGNELMGGAH